MIFAAYNGTSVDSEAIKWYTWSHVSHISVIESDMSREWEAWPKAGGVVECKPFTNHTSGTTVDLFDAPAMRDDQADKLRDFLRSQVGKPYDWEGIMRFLSHVGRPDSFNPWEQPAWFCSAVAFAGCGIAGYPLLDRIPFYKVSPGGFITSPRLMFLRGTMVP